MHHLLLEMLSLISISCADNGFQILKTILWAQVNLFQVEKWSGILVTRVHLFGATSIAFQKGSLWII